MSHALGSVLYKHIQSTECQDLVLFYEGKKPGSQSLEVLGGGVNEPDLTPHLQASKATAFNCPKIQAHFYSPFTVGCRHWKYPQGN